MDNEKLTKKDVEKIQKEIEERKLVVRPKALEDLKAARAQGDLSENFEYYAAKKFNRENNSRIEYLEKMLKNAIIVEDDDAAKGVTLNDKVKVLFYEDDVDEKDMDSDEYKIVTSIRSDSMKKKISIESPLGKALLGKDVGDIVTVNMDNGASYQVKIVSIEKSENEDEEIKGF